MVQGTVVYGARQAEEARDKALKAQAVFQEAYKGKSPDQLPPTRSYCACLSLPTLRSLLPDRSLLIRRNPAEPDPDRPGQSTSKISLDASQSDLPIKIKRPKQNRLTCVCRFPPNFVEDFQRVTAIAEKRGLLDAIGLSKELLDSEVKDQPQWLHGLFVATFRGSPSDIDNKAKRSLQTPVELFVLANRAMMHAQSEEVDRLSSFGAVTLQGETYVSSVYGLYQTTKTRLGKHFKRIFTPGWQNIQKIPELYKQGTFLDVYKRAWQTVLDGQPLELGHKMLEATGNVLNAAMNRDRSDKGPPDSGSSSGGGEGGAM